MLCLTSAKDKMCDVKIQDRDEKFILLSQDNDKIMSVEACLKSKMNKSAA